MMNISEILSFLPHRYPMLLVDKVIKIDETEQTIKTLKNVTYNENFFTGHFPGFPIMPGVLIIESIAQSAGILAIKLMEKHSAGKNMYFLSIENAKFRKTVLPGDTLIHDIQMIQQRKNICKFKAESYVNNDVVAEAKISAMIDI